MGVVLQTLSGFPSDSPAGCPLIGYRQNPVPIIPASISSTTEATGFPIDNVANPATHLKWKAGVNTGTEIITIVPNTLTNVDYVAVAGHNWGTLLVPITINIGGGAAEITTTLTNDDPVIFRFSPVAPSTLTISLAASGTEPPEAAVIYLGKLLVLERSITIGRGHVPITYGRKTKVVTGLSKTGNFLGRIVLGEYRESKAEFEWFTSAFYRSDIDLFLESAQLDPFFWAWSPDEYPAEVGYVWLTNDAAPEVDPATRRIALELQMRGIA